MKGLFSVRLGRLSYLLAAIVVALDQATKAFIVHGLDMTVGMSREVLGPIHFTFIYNTGFSFGLMQDTPWGRWALSAFSLIVSIALAVWAWKAVRPWLAAGIGLIMGGALGNLVDRVLIGHVIDFVDFGRIFPFIFNVADASITFGVIFLIYDQFMTPQPKAAP